MSDAAVASPAAEPKEHWATKAKREREEVAAGVRPAIGPTTEPTITPAPPVEAPPAPAPQAAPAPTIHRPVLTPDDFLANNTDPTAVSLFTGQTNSAAAFAGSMVVAYTSYLLTRSPKFSAWYKGEMDAGRVPKQVLPDPTIIDRFYDIATGA